MTTEIFKRSDGTFLNVEFIPGKDDKKSGIVYLHGLLSCMKSKKGQYLKDYAAQKGLSFLSFDFTSHGESWGKPTDFLISRCLQDATDVLNHYTKAPQIIIGSSMGGWIGMLLCEHLPKKVAAYIGVAAGADYTKFVWNNLLNEEHREALKSGKVIGPSEETSGYCFTYQMFQDAEQYFSLGKNISYKGPVRLLNGDQDRLVPYQTAFKIKDCFESDDVQIILIKGGEHRLSEPSQLAVLGHTIDTLIA